jgi:hypothetical protein
MLIISLPPIPQGIGGCPPLLIFRIFPRDGLTEAEVSLSATRLPKVAAAVLKVFQLYPVIFHEQQNLLRPGLKTFKISEKGPGAGPGFLFLTHNRCSCRLALGLNVADVASNDVQLHPIVQLFLGGVLEILHRLQGAPPFIA